MTTGDAELAALMHSRRFSPGSNNDVDNGGGGKDDEANVNHGDSSLGLNGLTRYDDT